MPFLKSTCRFVGVQNAAINDSLQVHAQQKVRIRGPGGGDSNMKYLDVCWESKNVPIMKDAFGKKQNTHIEGSSAHVIPILWCNIKQKCIIQNCFILV